MSQFELRLLYYCKTKEEAAVVKEMKILYTPGDIAALRVECRQCTRVLEFPLDKQEKLPTHCPFCHAQFKTYNDVTDMENLHYILRRLNDNASAFSVKLVIEGEE